MSISAASARRSTMRSCFVLCAAGIALNLLLSRLVSLAGIPLYLDSVGTVLTAVLGGYLPGMTVGFLSNVLLGIVNGDEMTVYYGVISVLIAALAATLARRGWFRTLGKTLLSAPLLALIGGCVGSLLTFALYELDFGKDVSSSLAHFFYDSGLKNVFWAQLSADLVTDLADKLVVVLIVFGLLRLIPEGTRKRLFLRFWQQNPLSAEERRASRGFTVRKMSLKPKFLILATAGMFIVAILTSAIGYNMYKTNMFKTDRKSVV